MELVVDDDDDDDARETHSLGQLAVYPSRLGWMMMTHYYHFLSRPGHNPSNGLTGSKTHRIHHHEDDED